jgi:hypothetical protein
MSGASSLSIVYFVNLGGNWLTNRMRCIWLCSFCTVLVKYLLYYSFLLIKLLAVQKKIVSPLKWYQTQGILIWNKKTFGSTLTTQIIGNCRFPSTRTHIIHPKRKTCSTIPFLIKKRKKRNRSINICCGFI